MPSQIVVKNPHSILAALESRPKEVDKIFIPPQALRSDPTWIKISQLASQNRIPVFQKNSESRGSKADSDGRHSGAEAHIEPKASISLQELFHTKPDGAYGVWMALDSLTDPHNVGALFRLASFFGVRGILMTSERSAPLTSTVYDVSCGGVESVPFTEQTNLKQALDFAKKSDLWILGTSEHAKQSYLDVPRDRNWLVVFGNEEKGMRRLTQETCDVLCQVPSKGAVTSLNVSVAAGVLISRMSSP